MKENNSLIINQNSQAVGSINLPGSKSISNRVLLLAALSSGKVKIFNLLISEDSKVMINALLKLGVKVLVKNEYTVVYGKDCKFKNKNLKINVMNSGITMRFLTATLSIIGGDYILDGIPRMRERPIKSLVESLKNIGCQIYYKNNNGFPPLKIKNKSSEIKQSIIEIDGSASSQYISALIIGLATLKSRIKIKINGQKISFPYVLMTLKLLKTFNVNYKINKNHNEIVIQSSKLKSPKEFFIEPDLSSASYFATMAIIGGGPIKLFNVKKKSLQGDFRFFQILKDFGFTLSFKKEFLIISNETHKKVPGFDLDLSDIPDVAMTLAILALFSKSKCTLRNIGSWRLKETDRLQAMHTELKKIGARTEIKKDNFTVYPLVNLNKKPVFNTYNDHRMAMCLSLLSFALKKITILDPKCVVKTFPDYFKKMKKVTQPPIITIDGPSASGKGTVSDLLAKKTGFTKIDSGRFYRVLSLYFSKKKINDPDLYYKNKALNFKAFFKFLHKSHCEKELRSEENSLKTSYYSSFLVVREIINKFLLKQVLFPGVIFEGRDMAKIFDNSCLKIYLTANISVRARRRHKQLIKKGINVNIADVKKGLINRDSADKIRKHSPLKLLSDHTVIDSSFKNVNMVVSDILNLYLKIIH